jgi:hypothetical protein
MSKRIILSSFAAGLLLTALIFTGACSSQTGNSLLSRKTTIPNRPITTWIWGKYIDEDHPLEYYVKFRNIGSEVISFDYTISDKPYVPHIDRDGPNSGLISNLYPGAEVAVRNPLNRWEVYVKVGKMVHGKRTDGQLQSIFPSASAELSSNTLIDVPAAGPKPAEGI